MEDNNKTAEKNKKPQAYVPPHRRHRPPRNEPLQPQQRETTTRRSQQLPASLQCIDRIRCINLERRPDKYQAFIKRSQAALGPTGLADRIQRFLAIDGSSRTSEQDAALLDLDDDTLIQRHWDATKNANYSRSAQSGPQIMSNGEIGCALSHVAIWKELVESSNDNNSKYCWILEDDAVFTTTTTSRNHTNTSNNNNNSNRFISAFDKAWRQLPHDWDILYLGFSSRGERDYVHQPFDKVSQQPPYRRNNNDSHDTYDDNSFVVELYRPEYGYHTHAYVITKDAAKTLLEHLPVTGPLDVWLADNQWFQLNVYCSVIANEGWKRQDGTYEGALLVSQDRGKGAVSDVSASARRKDARV